MRINVMALTNTQRFSGRRRDPKPPTARELVREARRYADLVSETGSIGPADMTTISDIRYGVVTFETAVRNRFGNYEDGTNA